MTAQRVGLAAAFAALAPAATRAFSFTFGSQPTQCQNATVNIVGDDGVPPYNIVILAYGRPPGGNEVRRIIDHSWSERSTGVQIAFPANSQFVAIVSDSKAFGNGGTTLSVNTGNSDDTTCLPTKDTLSPGFFLYLDNETITQCQPKRLAYSIDPATNGTVTLYGIIPGGDSFAIDMSGATRGDDGGMGINWTPNVPAFTDMMLMGGDARGRGSGGSTGLINVASGSDDCLKGDHPISTPGTPAGGVYPTSTTGSTSGGSKTNIGAIVGGVVGGLVFVIVILAGFLFWFWKRRRASQRNHIKEKPDLTDDPHAFVGSAANDHDLAAEPFIVPPSITSGSRPGTPSEATGAGGAIPPSAWARQHHTRTHSGGASQHRPLSLATTDEGGASSIGGLSAWERKHGASGGPQLRPVNVVQHEDGGEVEGTADTVELPPAYGNIRPRASPTPDAVSASGPSVPPPPATQ